MGNKESKKNSDTITPENDNRTSSKETKSKRSKSKKEKKSIEQKTPKTPRKEQQVMMPVDPNAVFANKEFLNDLSVFIVKAYDTKFDGTFNEYLVCTFFIDFKSLKVKLITSIRFKGITSCRRLYKRIG